MKSIIMLLALTLASQNQALAKFCYSEKDVTVGWGAYKTPAKAQVKGKLPSFKIEAKNKASSVKEILKGAIINISTDKIDSGNGPRDLKIAKFFFSTMSGGAKISATVKKIDKKKLILSVSMNGKTQDVPMSYKLDGKKLKAVGFIDVLDFSLNDELSAINQACKALHEGKTWSDVEITLEAKFTNC